jgi:hypothetical protein
MSASQRPVIVVLGRLCHDAVAGAVWHFLNYLLGFERLGFETYYVEWGDKWVPNPLDSSQDLGFPRVLVGDVLQRYGFGKRWICEANHIRQGFTYGPIPPASLPELYRKAEALINVSGTHILNNEQMECKRRVYLETDPGIPQIRLAEGDRNLESVLRNHTLLFTFAENIHSPDCLLPQTPFHYHTTRQPVVMDEWMTPFRNGQSRFTTIAKWTKTGKNVEFQGEVYRWSKRDELHQYIDLPKRCPEMLELALSKASDDDLTLLQQHGWRTTDALSVSSSLDRYREYIRESRGEFTIAKDQYVRLRTGWFSDRSACYLAAGKPVVTQDTGFAISLPTGDGLFGFRTLDDALSAFERIRSNYEYHCRAAQEISREYFNADKVLINILREIGLDPVRSGVAHYCGALPE